MYQLKGRNATVGIAISCGFGWILFGYDLGVLGGVLGLENFQSRFPLNAAMTGLVTGIFELFALLGALFMAAFGEKLGRKDNVALGTAIIAIGAAIQASAMGIPQLVVGRLIGGVGLGVFTAMCPIWQAEAAKPAVRGRVMGASLSCLVLGLIIAYWLDYGLAKYDSEISWRFPFAFQIVFAIVNIISSRFVPESPRYYLSVKKPEKAREALANLRGLSQDDPLVSEEFLEIQAALEEERDAQRGWWALLKKDDAVRSRRRLLTGCAIQMCQPWSGSTVISFYAPTIFGDSVGMSANLAGLMSGYLQIWFFVASIGTWYFIERVGRRRLFIGTALMMAVDMCIIGGCVKNGSKACGIVATIGIFLYQSFYTWGWMANVWGYNAEIQPLHFRSIGAPLGAATQWLFNYVVLQVAPVSFANIGYGTYFLFAAFNLIFSIFIYFFVPEVAGLPLESISLIFESGDNPIKKAKELRKLNKQGIMPTANTHASKAADAGVEPVETDKMEEARVETVN